jgi:hypothetical protein
MEQSASNTSKKVFRDLAKLKISDRSQICAPMFSADASFDLLGALQRDNTEN